MKTKYFNFRRFFVGLVGFQLFVLMSVGVHADPFELAIEVVVDKTLLDSEWEDFDFSSIAAKMSDDIIEALTKSANTKYWKYRTWDANSEASAEHRLVIVAVPIGVSQISYYWNWFGPALETHLDDPDRQPVTAHRRFDRNLPGNLETELLLNVKNDFRVQFKAIYEQIWNDLVLACGAEWRDGNELYASFYTTKL